MRLRGAPWNSPLLRSYVRTTTASVYASMRARRACHPQPPAAVRRSHRGLKPHGYHCARPEAPALCAARERQAERSDGPWFDGSLVRAEKRSAGVACVPGHACLRRLACRGCSNGRRRRAGVHNTPSAPGIIGCPDAARGVWTVGRLFLLTFFWRSKVSHPPGRHPSLYLNRNSAANYQKIAGNVTPLG